MLKNSQLISETKSVHLETCGMHRNKCEIVCKVRGFSLNHQNSLIVNFESMKRALYAWKNKEKCEILTVKTEILRNKVESFVYTKEVPKQYGVVIDKRRVLDDMTTVPFGFKML